jgi:hypothetical protein
MSESINPISMERTRGPYGYSLILKRRNRLNQVVAEINLAAVLDLGYARREELEAFFSKFLEGGSRILLDSEAMLKDQIAFHERRKVQLAASLKDSDEKISELEEALALHQGS